MGRRRGSHRFPSHSPDYWDNLQDCSDSDAAWMEGNAIAAPCFDDRPLSLECSGCGASGVRVLSLRLARRCS